MVAIQLISVPLLLHWLGSEAYGLIALQVTFLAIFSIFDFGISPSLARVLAVHSTDVNAKTLQNESLKTLEIINISLNVVMAALFFLLAPFIARYWINASNIPLHTITLCLQLIGIQCALQSVSNFYLAGLSGLQKMVAANSLLVINQTLRTVSGFAVILLIPANITHFFMSQVISSVVGLVISMMFIHRTLGSVDKKHQNGCISKGWQRFSLDRLRECKAYAGHLAITNVLGFFIFQSDKILVSKLVSLESFSYYSILANLGFIMAGAAGLIAKAATPRMTQLVELNSMEPLTTIYLKSSTIIGWLVLTSASMLMLFSGPFLHVYLNMTHVSQEIQLVFILLIVGHAIYSLSCMPYALSLSYGWGQYGVRLTLFGLMISLPMLLVLTFSMGIIGAAIAFAAFALFYCTFSIRLLHQKYLTNQVFTLIGKLAVPFLIALCIALFKIIQGL